MPRLNVPEFGPPLPGIVQELEIADVVRHENPVVLVGNREVLRIFGSCRSNIRCRPNAVAVEAQQHRGLPSDVLVQVELRQPPRRSDSA